MCREVNSRPSLPPRGEVFTEKIMEMVGSSTVITGSGRGSSGSPKVSPMKAAGTPATAAMSPAPRASREVRSSPSKLYTWLSWVLPVTSPCFISTISCPWRRVPLLTFPTAIRPT